MVLRSPRELWDAHQSSTAGVNARSMRILAGAIASLEDLEDWATSFVDRVRAGCYTSTPSDTARTANFVMRLGIALRAIKQRLVSARAGVA